MSGKWDMRYTAVPVKIHFQRRPVVVFLDDSLGAHVPEGNLLSDDGGRRSKRTGWRGADPWRRLKMYVAIRMSTSAKKG